jgi:8-oxo-dGTP pyrophosphatase MutT (NUDIX family)
MEDGAPKSKSTEEKSAGGVVVRKSGDAPRVLLIRDPYGKWGLPKGHLESGEGEEDAALREVNEETGLDDLELGADLGEIEWTFRRERRMVHKVCRFFLMRSEAGEARPELSEGITEVKWLSIEEAMRTVAYENARVVLERAAERLGDGAGGGEAEEAEPQGSGKERAR